MRIFRNSKLINFSQLSPNLQTIKRFWDPGLIHDSEQRQQRLLNDIKSVENILQYEMVIK